MAESVMAEILQNYHRPVHFAYLEKKVPCPNNLCNDSTAFYKKQGLRHHFRIQHPDIQFVPEKVERESSALMKKLHGDETRQLIETMFEIRSKQVRTYIFMLICIYE